MNVQFINPFLDATSHVLATMARLESTPGKVFLKDDCYPCGDITGFIHMRSPQTTGSLAISFSTAAILGIYHRMLGEPASTLNQDVGDLVGEITNMITGGAKRILEENGFHFDLARPTVIVGATTLDHAHGKHLLAIPFDSEAGRFFVEISFK